MLKRIALLVMMGLATISCGNEEPNAYAEVSLMLSIVPEPIVVGANSRVGETEAVPYNFKNQFSDFRVSATNTTTGEQYVFSGGENSVQKIAVPEGTYDIIVSGEGDNIYGKTLNFFGMTKGAILKDKGSVTVICTTKHALLILPKLGIDGVPTVGVWGNGSENYPPISMFEQADCYYIYVYDSWGYEVKYSVGGAVAIIQDTYQAGMMYDLKYISVSVNIVLPFS